MNFDELKKQWNNQSSDEVKIDSDLEKLKSANTILAKQTKPFVSIIQTADNHRPYTIPTEDLVEFKKVKTAQEVCHDIELFFVAYAFCA